MRALGLVLLLGACATTPGGIRATNVELAIVSHKPPAAFARCVADAWSGNNQFLNDGNHYWIIRLNSQGMPFARWDFLPTEAGSVAERRSDQLFGNAGTDRVRECAQG